MAIKRVSAVAPIKIKTNSLIVKIVKTNKTIIQIAKAYDLPKGKSSNFMKLVFSGLKLGDGGYLQIANCPDEIIDLKGIRNFTFPADEIPMNKTKVDEKHQYINLLPLNYVDLQNAILFASNDQTRACLCGIGILNNILWSTDGYRAYREVLDTKISENTSIPLHIVKLIIAFIKQGIQVERMYSGDEPVDFRSFDKSKETKSEYESEKTSFANINNEFRWIRKENSFLSQDKCMIIFSDGSRVVFENPGVYPMAEKVLPENNQAYTVYPRQITWLKDAIKKISPYVDKKTNLIVFNGIDLKVITDDIKYRVKLQVGIPFKIGKNHIDYSEQNASCGFNIEYLQEILNQLDSNEPVVFNMQIYAISPLAFTQGKKLWLIMPLKIVDDTYLNNFEQGNVINL